MVADLQGAQLLHQLGPRAVAPQGVVLPVQSLHIFQAVEGDPPPLGVVVVGLDDPVPEQGLNAPFGGLLARGLYEKYLKEGADFLPKYKAMLRETPMLSVEDSAGICGIDVSGRDFWRGSLEALKKDIEMFKKLVKQG